MWTWQSNANWDGFHRLLCSQTVVIVMAVSGTLFAAAAGLVRLGGLHLYPIRQSGSHGVTHLDGSSWLQSCCRSWAAVWLRGWTAWKVEAGNDVGLDEDGFRDSSPSVLFSTAAVVEYLLRFAVRFSTPFPHHENFVNHDTNYGTPQHQLLPNLNPWQEFEF